MKRNMKFNFVCGKPADKKVLVIILAILGAILVAISLTSSCGLYDYDELENTPRPQVVKEDPKPIYNDMGLSIGNFLIYVGDTINDMESRGLRVYKVRPDMGRDVAGKYKIYVVWVYYD